jgi:hypothetical protein
LILQLRYVLLLFMLRLQMKKVGRQQRWHQRRVAVGST